MSIKMKSSYSERLKPQIALISMMLLGIVNTYAQGATERSFLKLIDRNLNKAIIQYRYFSSVIPSDRFPRTLDDKGQLVTSGSDWWCSGFYPGTLLYLQENKPDRSLSDEVIRKLSLLEKEQYNKTTHDLGFMMYCSYGNAYRQRPDTVYRNILVNSAKSLASRFNPTVGCIRSWDKRDGQFIVIIDNMMNLELLFYATHVTGDSSYYKIAVSHANTTMSNHFRKDHSSYHVVEYDPKTGEVLLRRTHQGASDTSAWARGQGWGLYGFTVMYRETKNKKYLAQAEHIADLILNHPNMPADKVPFWDLNAADIPHAYRDASAAAVIASALIELSTFVNAEHSKKYLLAARTMIRSLSAPGYFATARENGGFLLKHSVGSFPHRSEVDKPLTYADYYFVEAMLRYKDLMRHQGKFLTMTRYQH